MERPRLLSQPLTCARRFVGMNIIRSGSQAPVKGPDDYFTGNVTISCSGASLKGWKVEWDYPAGQQLSQAWNSLCTQSGTHVTCTNADYNGTVPDGGSVTFGFNATWRGSNPIPSPITVT